jgi:hypothetical protein
MAERLLEVESNNTKNMVDDQGKKEFCASLVVLKITGINSFFIHYLVCQETEHSRRR